MLAYLPGLILAGYTDCHRRFLASIGYTGVAFASIAIGVTVHFFVSWYLIFDLRMGIIGTGISGIILNFLVFAL